MKLTKPIKHQGLQSTQKVRQGEGEGYADYVPKKYLINYMNKFVIVFLLLPFLSFSQITVVNNPQKGSAYFPIVSKASSASIVYSNSENILVEKASEFLASDIEKVTGKKPEISSSGKTGNRNTIIIGTVGKNPLINELVAKKKLDISPIVNQWERFIIQTIDNPFPGVTQALVIVGSDRRGAAFGVFTLSEKMGVSPWYWWADAPVKKNGSVFLKKGRYLSDGPAVKYRGIFINDESPAFRNWANEKFGGINHKCYEKIFELLLRNKANFLWPSMWLPTMFNVDDPLNPKTADEFGIVMSTSHHEPMMRAHNEWSLFKGGSWNYKTNKDKLQQFWRGGIKRMGNYESVVTVGMRGDGDEGMSEETAVDLLQTVIKDQREIIADVTGKPAEKTPQLWAIYKEVQDYYDKGMQVDNDITILFSDDNWGNIRYLPKKKDLNHAGGYGMYYHFDYVGAPVSYRWLNVTQIERVWEQMKLTYEHGVNTIWIANVGDIKPMELPTSFFLDYAWNPKSIEAAGLSTYYQDWSKQQFGDNHAKEIAGLLALYTKFNSRRIPEMLTPATYSLENYREADRVVEDYKRLVETARNIYQQLPNSYRSAFYQLVLSPIELSSNLNEMYICAAKNKLYASQGRASANIYAEKVKELFSKDAELTGQFHKDLEGGKWNHMMSQTHMGYTSWNHPRTNVTPPVSYIKPDTIAKLGFMVEYGPAPAWGGFSVEANPLFSNSFIDFDPVNKQSYYLEIFNMGQKKLNYEVEPKNDWITLSKTKGDIQYDEKVYVSINWDKAPKGKAIGSILIKGAGMTYIVRVPIRNSLPIVSGFVENNGVVAIEASNYTKKVDSKDIRWTVVPNLGRTNSSMIIEPVTAARQTPGGNSPRVEYEFSIFDKGDLTIEAFLSPTQDFKKQDGLRFAISIDEEAPKIVNMNEGEIKPDYEYAEWWAQSVADHIKIKRSSHKGISPGKHTLKIWMVDPGIVFQKFVINRGGLRSSYLGPTESTYIRP
ncbi:glycosyl hydrolase 115 family protein [Desertivirga brevis]|uniref:glycosyl hydrolase 115 family protein n=1 Tax=Desertivirga brevis TaxID=2810310 RepID=UPI001A96884D|nr:glycosyl hydrolase 115 family protein [Pedobacter sp. SYSU D00873]